MRGVKRLGQILGIVLAIVAGAEAYFRFVLKENPTPFENHFADSLANLIEFDPVTGTRFRINIDQTIDSPAGDFAILYKTNEINLRDHAMGTHLRQELKFLVFGDEFAEGWGNDIDRTFVVQAQNLVNEKTALKPPIRLVIAAHSGYGAAQNYLEAKSLFETLHPKAAVFFYTSLMPHADQLFLRDATLIDGLATGLKPEVAHTPRMPHAEDYPQIQPGLLARLSAISTVLHHLTEFLAARAASAAIKVGDPATDRLAGIRAPAADLAAVHQPSLRYVSALADLAKAQNVPFLLIHLPLPPQISATEWANGRDFFKVAGDVNSSDDLAVIEKFCAETGIKCLSLHTPMREAAGSPVNGTLFYRTELALTLNGSTWLGSWLAEQILHWMVDLGYWS